MCTVVEHPRVYRPSDPTICVFHVSVLQRGLPFTPQLLPASGLFQQADREHVGYRQVKEAGDDQKDDRGWE